MEGSVKELLKDILEQFPDKSPEKFKKKYIVRGTCGAIFSAGIFEGISGWWGVVVSLEDSVDQLLKAYL